jgi:glutamate-1-semialdehyde 2,1-aminomutase
MTAGLYGHSDPILKEALISTYDTVGVSLGATNTHEVALAKLICDRFRSLERVRFCNSGTEANIYALSIARHYTRKRKVLVFRGGYHGGVLSFGHGGAANTVDQGDYILCDYNDTERAEEIIKGTPDLAAILVEAMQGAGGCVVGDNKFLTTLESAAKSVRVLLLLFFLTP